MFVEDHADHAKDGRLVVGEDDAKVSAGVLWSRPHAKMTARTRCGNTFVHREAGGMSGIRADVDLARRWAVVVSRRAAGNGERLTLSEARAIVPAGWKLFRREANHDASATDGDGMGGDWRGLRR